MKKIIHQIRCPECNGRLFDVIAEKNSLSFIDKKHKLMIKCWKCHNTILLKKTNNDDYLVQASHDILNSE